MDLLVGPKLIMSEFSLDLNNAMSWSIFVRIESCVLRVNVWLGNIVWIRTVVLKVGVMTLLSASCSGLSMPGAAAVSHLLTGLGSTEDVGHPVAAYAGQSRRAVSGQLHLWAVESRFGAGRKAAPQPPCVPTVLPGVTIIEGLPFCSCKMVSGYWFPL